MADPSLSSFIWSVADLLRGNYKQSEYGKVILPFTVHRSPFSVDSAAVRHFVAAVARRYSG
jgi:type I restriction enzyme M protein